MVDLLEPLTLDGLMIDDVTTLRLAGTLMDLLRDTFAVTANNGAGARKDVYVTNATRVRGTLKAPAMAGPAKRIVRTDGTVRLVRTAPRGIRMRQMVVNSLFVGAFDLHVTGNCVSGYGQSGFAGREGDDRAFLTFRLRGSEGVLAV